MRVEPFQCISPHQPYSGLVVSGGRYGSPYQIFESHERLFLNKCWSFALEEMNSLPIISLNGQADHPHICNKRVVKSNRYLLGIISICCLKFSTPVEMALKVSLFMAGILCPIFTPSPPPSHLIRGWSVVCCFWTCRFSIFLSLI